MTKSVTTIPANQFLTVTGTWEGARHWLSAGKMFEQGKLFAQVMAGFELSALQKKHGIQRGGDRSNSQNESLNWESLLKKETGLSVPTSYRIMAMAKKAAPRIKKIAGLRDLDLLATPFSQLSDEQRTAIASAVKKITDGKTQQDFGEELGIWKKPQGSGAKGGKLIPAATEDEADATEENAAPAPGKKLSLSEEADLRRQQATLDWAAIDKMMTAYHGKFLLLPDADINAQIALLEKALAARRTWIKQPKDKRDARAATECLAK